MDCLLQYLPPNFYEIKNMNFCYTQKQEGIPPQTLKHLLLIQTVSQEVKN